MPEAASLPDIEVPPAEMEVRDVCLYRSDRGEKGMVYTVIGHSNERIMGEKTNA